MKKILIPIAIFFCISGRAATNPCAQARDVELCQNLQHEFLALANSQRDKSISSPLAAEMRKMAEDLYDKAKLPTYDVKKLALDYKKYHDKKGLLLKSNQPEYQASFQRPSTFGGWDVRDQQQSEERNQRIAHLLVTPPKTDAEKRVEQAVQRDKERKEPGILSALGSILPSSSEPETAAAPQCYYGAFPAKRSNKCERINNKKSAEEALSYLGINKTSDAFKIGDCEQVPAKPSQRPQPALANNLIMCNPILAGATYEKDDTALKPICVSAGNNATASCFGKRQATKAFFDKFYGPDKKDNKDALIKTTKLLSKSCGQSTVKSPTTDKLELYQQGSDYQATCKLSLKRAQELGVQYFKEDFAKLFPAVMPAEPVGKTPGTPKLGRKSVGRT